MTANRIRRYLIAIPFVVACASTGPSPELVSARDAYTRAAASRAATDAPGSLVSARHSLDAAERAHASDPGSTRARHLAYLAERHALIAIAHGNAGQAERTTAIARDTVQRRAQEAARAAERAKAEAERTQRSLAETERNLAETQRQLAAKGNQLDEQARQLREREVELQAQLNALRAERDQALQAMRAIAKVHEEDRGLVITIPSEVMFRYDEATLLPRAKEKLDTVAEALQNLGPDQQFVIEGHTDARGGDAYNRDLSRRRAEAVRVYLIAKGVDPDRIVASGKGEANPVASNQNPEGRANNRRVEIVVSPPVVSRR